MKRLTCILQAVFFLALLQTISCSKKVDVAPGDSINLESSANASVANEFADCPLRTIVHQVGDDPQAPPAIGSFNYYFGGNPHSLTYPGNQALEHYFFYDDRNRLIEWRLGYSFGYNPLTDTRHKYGYNSSDQIIVDTILYPRVAGEPGRPEDTAISQLTYDAQGRIVQEVIKYGNGTSTRTRTYTYDSRGNLVLPGWDPSWYDSKVSLFRNHPVFMFVMRNYSRNNPLSPSDTGRTYNRKGLPSSIKIGRGYFFNASSFERLEYDCDALLPLPCHTTNFVSDYPITPGQQPPFRFTKTLYPDTRVNNINMLSRAVPNHPAYKKLMWETTGQFSYAPNQATLTGTRELWEYYKTPTGAAARRSVSRKKLSLTFNFNNRGHVQTVVNNLASYDSLANVYYAAVALHIQYGREVPSLDAPPESLAYIYVTEGSEEGYGPGQLPKTYKPSNDPYGNPMYLTTISQGSQDPLNSGVVYAYDYNIPRNGRNYSFIPSQNLISYEYNLCEVMQWLPQPTHQRARVTGFFWLNDAERTQVTQNQQYKNYVFDAKGNQISVTYGDNVLQKTTWHCK